MTDMYWIIFQISVLPCLVCFVLGGVIGVFSMFVIDNIYYKKDSEFNESDDDDGL